MVIISPVYVWLLLFITSSVFGKSVFKERTHHKDNQNNNYCGYSSCPEVKEGFINVHLIPHTHDDVGWLKTVDQYFFGSKSTTQLAGVQYILDSVVQELKHDPSKRFIYVETAFFWKWWQRQTDQERHLVKRLVARGQLEFIGGGWSMHDEAATHYQSIVDQFTWGFRKLNDTFGQCGVPRVGWQIDPFGHSRETASIMARLGFDGLLVGRIDYMDKATRMIKKQMEMVWEASPNLGKDADLFTGVLFNTYSAPSGFCFDILCADEPIIDDKKSPDYNAEKRALLFLAEIVTFGLVYKGTHIAVTMGEDFNFQAAHINFSNIDRLIKAVNDRQVTHNSNVNLLYSTPSCYLKALNSEGLQWPTKQDDFFPYASDPHAFWTGYFTSRPTLKLYERLGNNFLQVCKQLYAFGNLGSEDRGNLNVMREAMGVMQHHDAVSGTEKQLVAFDYARQLSLGFDECGIITETALNKLITKPGVNHTTPLAMTSCLLLNISQCEISETHNTFVVTLYNPLSRSVSRYVRLPVAGDGHAYSVQDPQGKPVTVQVVPVPDSVSKMPGRFSEASVELVFRAVDLPPLGFRSYYVSPSNTVVAPLTEPERITEPQFTIGRPGSMRLTIDGRTGLPTRLHGLDISDTPNFQQSFCYYQSAVGNNEESKNRSSGAYIFRPNSSCIMVNSQPTIKYFKGPLVEEVHQQFSSWLSQVIRAYRGEDHILEFNWMVGPIPISDQLGKEVVTRYSVYEMATNSTFYTDSNGREMLKRVLDQRPTFKVKLEEPIAGNYYPVNTRIMMKDDKTHYSIITDRSQGGTSLRDGEMEIMLHRRILHDDAFGVDEALNEQAFGRGLVARGTHYLTGGTASSQSADRHLVQERVLAAWTFLTPTSLSLAEWQMSHHMEFSGLKKALPDTVQILTLEPWKGTSFLLRLEHILEKDDDKDAVQPVLINLQDIFQPFTIKWVRETTLGANQWLEDVSRLVWKKENNQSVVNHGSTNIVPAMADLSSKKPCPADPPTTHQQDTSKLKRLLSEASTSYPKAYQYSCCFIILSIIFIFSTVGCSIMWFTDLYLDSILNQMTLKEDTELFEAWKRPPVKPLICVHVFNYTNMENFTKGLDNKIHVNETGPYCYRETLEKTNIQFYSNGTVSYGDRRTHVFEEKNSTGSVNDTLVVPNLPLISAIAMSRDSPSLIQMALGAILRGFGSATMLKLPAHEFLFGYNDTFIAFIQGIVKFLDKDLPFEKFGILAMRAAETKERITVRTGTEDLNSIGMVTALNGQEHLTAWDDDECNRVDGSDGMFFPRHEINQSATLYLFHKDLCRRLPLIFKDEVDFQDGVMGMRFHPPHDVYNTTGSCFCKKGSCPPVGVFDISPCAMGAPIMMSLPHFLNAEPSVTAHLEGIHPNVSRHDFFIDVQPILGFTLGTVSRIQLNIQIRKSHRIPLLNEFNDGTILPVVWFEVTADRLPPDLFKMIYHASVTVPLIQSVLKWGMLAACVTSGCGMLLCWPRRRPPVTTLMVVSPPETEIIILRLSTV